MIGHVAAAGSALLLFAAAVSAPAQTAPEPALTGESRPQDMLTARRLTMDAIGRNNDWLHDSVDGHFTWDPVEVRARLDAISTMLATFPHLYHPATDIWSPELEAADAATVSLSTGAVWERFDSFYALAMAASDTAFSAATAGDDAEVVGLINDLETQCELCHDTYRQLRVSGRDEFATGD